MNRQASGMKTVVEALMQVVGSGREPSGGPEDAPPGNTNGWKQAAGAWRACGSP